ncbi:hypothetical protein JJQ59_04875 [Cupriavidus necator]|uniref:Uncharacterized protein n=1 Tax=Cupriavidus necator TaxID=106590 RepID=A0A367PQ44_CUPNE|nr:hypothetical protein [Cupriavidus necator]QQX85277.1 hypothetical protein JJQ59_04875 [Cupriavidus necator]RCJ09045.1 hypothetical protein DDK22_07280 [Cupriavidus necator]
MEHQELIAEINRLLALKHEHSYEYSDAFGALLRLVRSANEEQELDDCDLRDGAALVERDFRGMVYVNVFQDGDDPDSVTTMWCDQPDGCPADGTYCDLETLVEAAAAEVEEGRGAVWPDWYEDDWVQVEVAPGEVWSRGHIEERERRKEWERRQRQLEAEADLED